MKKLAIFIIILTACFARPLYAIAQYSLHSQFFSYIPLIPVISLYLIWQEKTKLPPQTGTSWKGAALMAAGGAALLAGWVCALHSGWRPRPEDYLTVMMASYLMFLTAGCFAFLGSEYMRVIAFPMAFLVFAIPMPAGMLGRTELFFQQTSALTALGMLKAAFMPAFLDHLVLNLPGFQIIVAPECSGIHSTMVLLITAVLAGHLFLQSGWKRAFLVVFVIPLAIVRNGFRIFVISELCVQISHDMIDSPIHHRGGPIFFVLSLIPFFWLLFRLRKSELPESKTVEATVKV